MVLISNRMNPPPPRKEIPISILIHPENSLPRQTPSGFKIFDFMRSVSHLGMLDPGSVLLRGKFSSNLFRIHKQLFEAIFSHFPVAYVQLPDIEEGVYTFRADSDLTVARFVEWAYNGEYPEFVDLDRPVRPKMPKSRYKYSKDRIDHQSSLISAYADSSNGIRNGTFYRQDEPKHYSITDRAFITGNYPFSAHLRVYVFARLYQLPLLEEFALGLAKESSRSSEKLPMDDNQQMICKDILDISKNIPSDDPVEMYIGYVIQYNVVCHS